MNFSCTKERLNYAVATVQKAVASKTPLSILTGIYVSAKDNKVELQATDYEIGISCIIDADIQEPGTVVLSGRYLQEMVRKLPGERIIVETNQEDKTVKITSNFSQFNLLTMPAEEFPVLKPLASDSVCIVKDNVLRELIKKTVFACATDEARPIFTGGLLEADNNNIRMVATNTHRLALKTDIVDDHGSNLSMIIPSKILQELARLLTSEVPVDVKLCWQKNQVSFTFDDVYIISRLIEGQFPDYKKVIPANFATTVKVPSHAFLGAVERVSLLARDGEYNVIKFQFDTNGIVITSNNPDIGKARETIDAQTQGNEVEIAFNAKYVTDILKNIDSEELIFSLNTPLSPACIKPADDDKYTYIITPVRTN